MIADVKIKETEKLDEDKAKKILDNAKHPKNHGDKTTFSKLEKESNNVMKLNLENLNSVIQKL